ncbi:MAG: hypothetical protein WA947_19420 [Phormidesmis sp.]
MLRRSGSQKLVLTISERQKEDERIRDVEMLLESLFLREEITVRLIVDCLYDVGSVNLVNQRVPSRPLNRLLKMIARHSKPVFRIFIVRWVKQNCPHMIANWLHSQVIFKPGDSIIAEVVNPQVETPYMK